MKLWKHNERRQQRNRMSHGWPFYEGILSTDRQKEGKSCTYMWWKILGIRKSKTKDVGAVTSRDLCQKVWRSLWWEWALKWIVKMIQNIYSYSIWILYIWVERGMGGCWFQDWGDTCIAVVNSQWCMAKAIRIL